MSVTKITERTRHLTGGTSSFNEELYSTLSRFIEAIKGYREIFFVVKAVSTSSSGTQYYVATESYFTPPLVYGFDSIKNVSTLNGNYLTTENYNGKINLKWSGFNSVSISVNSLGAAASAWTNDYEITLYGVK